MTVGNPDPCVVRNQTDAQLTATEGIEIPGIGGRSWVGALMIKVK
jgi:hypothetical protein